MAPKAPAADPGVAVTTAIGQAEAADDALVKAAALEPVLQLLSDPSALPAVVEHLDALFAQTGALIASVAAVAAADLTAELAGAVSTAAQLVTAFCEAGTPSKAALAACVPPLGALIGAPSPPAWSETELVESEARAALLTSACSTLHSLATLPSGRLALRTAAVAPALLALLQPALSSQPALQAHAALALSRLAESALSRATLAAPDTLPSLVGLVSTLSAPPPPTDALALRVHAKLLLLVGFCLYDACLLSPLFAAGLVDTTLKLLLPPPPPPPLEDGAEPPPEPSADALKCAAELRSNAATVLAIAGQSPAGRELVAKAGGLTILADALSPLVRADDAAGGDKAALAANVTLALAHAALSAAGAAKLAALPQLIPSLAALLAPTPDGAVPGWAAVRGNACTALMHVVAAPAGRTAFLSSPASPAPPPIAEEEGEEGAATPVDAPPAHSYQSALSVVVALLAHATPATEEESAEPPPPPETDPGLLASAADILSACALDSNGCDAVVSAGGAHALLALLGGADQPPSLTEALVSAYAALAANPTACVMLRGASPPPPAEPAADDADAPPAEDAQAPPPPPSPLALVPTLLMSPSEGLCRAAASLATSACADAVNAATLVRLQTLPMLSQLAPTSSAAKAALDALCVAVPSAQLWRAGTLGTGVAIGDGFYGVTRDAQMLDVETLAKSNVGTEVLLVDTATDPALAECCALAAELVAAQPTPAEAAAALARLVCDRLGGPVPYEVYQHYDAPSQAVDALRAARASRVLPLGQLTVGGARHRATLFKALADRTGAVPCSLTLGKCIRGAHAHHAWNVLLIGDQEVVVDLCHAPGAIYADASDAARKYKRIDEHAFASLTADGGVYALGG